jgi:hypothetical protein
MTNPVSADKQLLADVRYLIDTARQRVAGAVNAELTQLYWQIGRRIDKELLQGQRAEYGKRVISELARLLTAEFGKGWSEQQLRHCLRMAEVYNDEQILSTVWRELSWSHLKRLIYIDDPLKRDFYFEICRLERWSVRQLQERIKSLLYEHIYRFKHGSGRGRNPLLPIPPKHTMSAQPHNVIPTTRCHFDQSEKSPATCSGAPPQTKKRAPNTSHPSITN